MIKTLLAQLLWQKEHFCTLKYVGYLYIGLFRILEDCQIIGVVNYSGGPWWPSWLRCHAGNQRVAGSSFGAARKAGGLWLSIRALITHTPVYYHAVKLMPAYAGRKPTIDWCSVQGELSSQLLAPQKPGICTGLIGHIGPSTALPFTPTI